MSESHSPAAAQAPLPPEVAGLLTAARDALDCTGLDYAGMIRRMVEVKVYLDSVLVGAEDDARCPDLPARWPEHMADTTALLRRLTEGGAR